MFDIVAIMYSQGITEEEVCGKNELKQVLVAKFHHADKQK